MQPEEPTHESEFDRFCEMCAARKEFKQFGIDVEDRTTVTIAANAIINSKHLLTWNGTKGSKITLQALGGVWVPVGTASGVTVS